MKKVRSRLRPLIGLVAGILLASYLHGLQWPWWAWLPASILCAMAVFMVQVLGWFLWRKVTYETFARRARRRNRAAAAAED